MSAPPTSALHALPAPAGALWPGRSLQRDTLRQHGLAALALFVLLAATAWARPLMLPDEGRYVGVAWEMLRTGHWATPMLDGLPFFHKPPLFYWITAAAMSVFGAHDWAARTASILGAWLGAMGLFSFTYRWRGRAAAWSVALVLGAQPLFFVGGQFANLDMLVAGCITATVLCAAHAALQQQAGLPYRLPLLAAYGLAALAVLAKGLIGVVLPGMVVVAWLLATGRLSTLPRLLSMSGLLLFMAIAAPWFIVMQRAFPDFLHYFFVVQHFQRFSGTGFNNVQPWWFYGVLLAGVNVFWLPWAWRIASPAFLRASRRDPVRLLMWLWLGVVVGFFSLPQSKLIGYVLPALPPLAYLLSDSFHSGPRSSQRAQQRWWWGASAAALATACAFVTVLAVAPVKSNRPLALTLRNLYTQGEPVYMLEGYYYDVAYYAALPQPAAIVDDWQSPQIPLSDNWRKEIADAARFAPDAGRTRLLSPAQWTHALCDAPQSWIIGAPGPSLAYPFLRVRDAFYRGGNLNLWRVDRDELQEDGLLQCGRKAPAH